jgi:hypothetical protein
LFYRKFQFGSFCGEIITFISQQSITLLYSQAVRKQNQPLFLYFHGIFLINQPLLDYFDRIFLRNQYLFLRFCGIYGYERNFTLLMRSVLEVLEVRDTQAAKFFLKKFISLFCVFLFFLAVFGFAKTWYRLATRNYQNRNL